MNIGANVRNLAFCEMCGIELTAWVSCADPKKVDAIKELYDGHLFCGVCQDQYEAGRVMAEAKRIRLIYGKPSIVSAVNPVFGTIWGIA